MRTAFAHQATVVLEPGGDDRGPGGAVTVALCGHWEHEPPCRWPHYIATAPGAGERAVTVRVVFACPPAEEMQVRGRLSAALAGGTLDGPDGPVRWRLVSQHPDAPTEPELALAARWSAA